VDDVSLDVQAGEFVVITGRSGSGKTTLLNLAAGLTTPTSGEVFLDGSLLGTMPDDERSRLRSRKVGFVFQFPSLLPNLTALENVLLPASFGGDSRPDTGSRALELLETVGLSPKLHSYPRQLSAGEQQRVVLARSLVNRPEILMADEPSSNLDERTEVEMMDLLRRVHAETQVTVLLVTHSAQLVAYGTRSVQMAAGSLVTS
jgi:ABC-type lipoprotein export system ATPase subunit